MTRPRPRALALILALAAGGAAALACQFQVDYGGSHFACSDGQCPAGYQCVNALCERDVPPDDPDAAPAPPDAPVALPDGPAPVADATPVAADADTTCYLSLMKDNFTDGALGPIWMKWSDAPATVSETGGALQIDMPSGQAGSHYAGYDSLPGDARGQRVTIKLVQAPDGGTAAQGFFKLENPVDYNQAAYFLVEAGTLYWYSKGPSINYTGSSPYSATNHRFLGIREQGGTVFLETSPDGSTWTTRGAAAVPVPWSYVRIAVGGGTWKSEGIATQVKFDDLNGGGSPSGCML